MAILFGYLILVEDDDSWFDWFGWLTGWLIGWCCDLWWWMWPICSRIFWRLTDSVFFVARWLISKWLVPPSFRGTTGFGISEYLQARDSWGYLIATCRLATSMSWKTCQFLLKCNGPSCDLAQVVYTPSEWSLKLKSLTHCLDAGWRDYKPCEKSGNERCASCKRACSCWSFTGFGRADDSCRGPTTVQKSGGRRELPKS